MDIKNKIGIIGGMGPEATIQLQRNILKSTPAKKDQDHLEVFTINNPNIPDRTNFILKNEDDPYPMILDAAKKLEFSGANFLAISCNTAHIFADNLRKDISIPFIDMVDETKEFIKVNYPGSKRIGLLATTGTIVSNIYTSRLEREGFDIITPASKVQKDFVMKAIYEIKSGKKSNPKILLEAAASYLVSRGADIIIMGCTEIPLTLKQENVSYVVIDPLKILSETLVKRCTENKEKLLKVN